MSDEAEPGKAYNPETEGAEMRFADKMSYGDYLGLTQILNAQAPLSDASDELLFIIQHQTSELWMKLMLHELNAARDAIADDHMPQAMKLLARVSRIMEQLNSAWDVLRTMTPSDYTQFRDALGMSSGFQSLQYRLIEYALGNRNTAMIRPHEHDAQSVALLNAELARPSLYQVVLAFARRQGLDVPDDAIAVPASAPHLEVPAIMTLWQKVYRDPSAHWALYEVGEKLVDLEDYFRRWRFNHVTTVERVIGFKRGTGGTGGVSYLKRMLEVELFPELWHVRTAL
ncbi:tryptophan 2,3-dioxygenase [Roseibium algicola]|uniref:Tryptophan 2,3-dioxygenase n=1 Tax=Roseibium algicola TaxID=2857014 RepID=A0ABM6I409_9HYPH|nr:MULTISPECIES: tryptophan 2,3-dioxygenase [Stappiaceae]MEC9472576.1 tryptophan 2,3-dioxygenase [Pseudomonadota bacterium]AQQ05097.1 tryptophan 2,3-dioxygenase [Roseibium aggregatum]ERP86254.1 tryptophan 2,3-dioxygenase [Labrenzia sp. C1B10]ERS06736.1 tryptophan 2,3-dioxygenase [Labrenzia sp. C1B70]MBO6858927.1 tryptophan 2,3-dioxygenase [Roseibium sp.]